MSVRNGTITHWYEARLKRGALPMVFYRGLSYEEWLDIEHVHHFFDEPWWPGCFVVRIKTSLDEQTFSESVAVDHVVTWDASPDEELFGEEAWPIVMSFFMAGSMLSGDPRVATSKLVHCFLNSHGLSVFDEARWAGRFLWNRLTIKLRWRLYLRRRWERGIHR